LSVVLPAHNEAALLEATVTDLVSGLDQRGRDFELLVVENGSTDGTLALARRLAEGEPRLRVLSNRHADYGDALATGFAAARGDVVANFDVDYYDLDFLDYAEKQLADGSSIVVASKRAPGSEDRRPPLRRVLTAGFTTALRVGFGLPVSDAHGMKAMRRADLVPIVAACRMRGSLFDVEMVLRAGRSGLGAAETAAKVEERRPPRTAVWRRSLESLRGLVELRVLLWRERIAARRSSP
jgi:glycosyltransferase involved in cell wall biosynthesis